MRNSAKVVDHSSFGDDVAAGGATVEGSMTAHQRKSSLSLPLGSALHFREKADASSALQSRASMSITRWATMRSMLHSLDAFLTTSSFAVYALACCVIVGVPLLLQPSPTIASHPLQSQPVLMGAVATLSFAAPLAIELLVDAYQRYFEWADWTPRILMLASIVSPAVVVVIRPGDEVGDQLFRLSLVLEVLVWSACCLVMLHHDTPRAFSMRWVFAIFTSLFVAAVLQLYKTSSAQRVFSALSIISLLIFTALFTLRIFRAIYIIYRKYSWRLSNILTWVDQLEPQEYSSLVLGSGALVVVYFSLLIYFFGNQNPTQGLLGFTDLQFLLYLISFSLFLMIVSLLTNRCNKHRVMLLQHDLDVKRTYVK